MRVVLTGGCTGGHIYPALAIGDKIKEMEPDSEFLYIAHEYGLETAIVPKAGYQLKTVVADWLRRDNPMTMLKTVCNTGKGAFQAGKIMKKFKPDIVVSTGSFVSVPVVLAAIGLGIPFYMHEQNGFPGVSNRSFAGKAKAVFLGFDSARQYFKDKSKVIYSGNPVRKDFYGRDRIADRKTLGIPVDDTVITVFGGSLGSDTINGVGLALIREFGKKKGYTVIFGTGKEYNEVVNNELKKIDADKFDNVRVNAFIADMPEVMSASDLVVSRAGALTVAETTMTGKAAIFVPSPNVTADHQYYNAKAVADNGGAVIVRENKDTANQVLEEVRRLVTDKDRLNEMSEASAKLAPTGAADIIYKHIAETYK